MLTKNRYQPHSFMMSRDVTKILCPTDLTAESDQALRYAAALARAYGAKLFICHCVEKSNPNDLAQISSQIKGLYHIKKIFASSANPSIKPAELPELEWEGVVLEGDPAEAIIHEAALRHIDLIVMRSRRRPIAAALLGSTAESICRTAPCPVLVTHPVEREWVNFLTGEIGLKRVLVAYDFSDGAEIALSYAVSLAEEFRCELHLLNVLPVRPESAWYPLPENLFHQATARLNRALPAEVYKSVNILSAVREGPPYREILDYAEENNIDLICMGANGAGFGLHALFGSNVDRVLRQAPSPVFIARPLKWES